MHIRMLNMIILKENVSKNIPETKDIIIKINESVN